MAIGLYVHNKQAVTNEMKGYRIWSAMMRPKYFDIPDDLKKLTGSDAMLMHPRRKCVPNFRATGK
jgi:hypothetical protein